MENQTEYYNCFKPGETLVYRRPTWKKKTMLVTFIKLASDCDQFCHVKEFPNDQIPVQHLSRTPRFPNVEIPL